MPRAPRTRRGLTLLELILTMAILGIVLGVGVGVLAGLDLSSGSGAGWVRGGLRAAHSAALAERAPAALRYDPAERALVTVTQRAVGTWQFERDDLRGARELAAVPFGAVAPVDAGYLGRAVAFSPSRGGAGIELGLALGTAFDPTDGFSVDLALFLAEARSGVVFDMYGVAGLTVAADGGLNAWMRLVREDRADGAVHGRLDLEVPAGQVGLGRWARVVLTYDRSEFTLEVDGRVLAREAERQPLAQGGGRFVLGDGQRPFSGALDALVVRQVELSEPVALPPGLDWPAAGPFEVRFAADGTLDRRLHPEPLVLDLMHLDGFIERVRVSRFGGVE